MGLFLGCTIFSLTEPFELVYNIALLLVCKFVKAKNKKQNGNAETETTMHSPYHTSSFQEEGTLNAEDLESEFWEEDLAAKKKGLTSSQVAWD